jgi:cupin fold WbuC family metalloprotein
MHPDLSDPIQRMLNAGYPGSYVRPHRHGPDRWENFTLIQGAIAVLLFDDKGIVASRTELHRGGIPLVELPGLIWHSIVFLQPASVVYELKPGPYVPAEDKDFAAWAPSEGQAGAAELENWMTTAQPGQRWFGQL